MNMLASLIPSGPDMVWLLLIVLLLFGHKKLPELARGLRQSMNEFSKGKEEVAKTPGAPESGTGTPPGTPANNKDTQKPV